MRWLLILCLTPGLLARSTAKSDGFERYIPEAALADQPTPPWVVGNFKTEPRIHPEYFDFRTFTTNASLLAPGYLFADPGRFQNNEDYHGPQIYDMWGNLIFYGPGRNHSNDLHVCDFQGVQGTHLCIYQLEPKKIKRRYVVDATYTNVVMSHEQWTVDGHDYNMLPGGESYLFTHPEFHRMDMTPYAGPEDGWAQNGCFADVDSRTQKKIFDWCYLDHGPIWATTMFPYTEQQTNRTSPKAGKGTEHDRWDFFHPNAADRMNGDYLFSSRHMDQIFKIAGPNNSHGVEPGTILWKIGGTVQNDFEMNFTFTKQHHVRFISETSTGTTFSIFNNAWEGTNPPSSREGSSGQIIRVNNETMTAVRIGVYLHPQGMLAEGRGSTQVLPNGNVLVGFGTVPDVAEYAADGTLLWWIRHAREWVFADPNRFNGKRAPYSYRWIKSPWVGQPQWDPKLVAEATSCADRSSPINVWVSWNGATEVARWQFKTAVRENGPWVAAGIFPKSGFETSVTLLKTERGADRKLFIVAEALDADGSVLAKTVARTTCPTLSAEPGSMKYVSSVAGLAWLIVLVETFSLVASSLLTAGSSPPPPRLRMSKAYP